MLPFTQSPLYGPITGSIVGVGILVLFWFVFVRKGQK